MNAPCVRCGEPHTYDEKRGWRAEDGHAYLRDARPPSEVLASVDSATISGWRSPDHGVSASCPLCAAKVDNRRADIDAHEAWHAGQTVSA